MKKIVFGLFILIFSVFFIQNNHTFVWAQEEAQPSTAENTAKEAFDALQKAKKKNERLYRAAFQYMLRAGYLENHGSKTAREIEFGLIATGVKKRYPDSADAEDAEYKILANLFKKAQINPVQEIRESIANGGILPGARAIIGANNQDVGTKYVGEVVIPKFVNTILVLSLSVSTILLIAGGAMYVFSSGEDEMKTKAKDIIFWTIVGIIIIAMSYTIIKFVITLNFEI